jgi:hypothetical protein
LTNKLFIFSDEIKNLSKFNSKLKIMKKFSFILLAVLFLTTTAFVYVQQNRHTEAAKHPRVETAIKELESAIDYLEKAPDTFGGYKAQAIADSKRAVASLKLALSYRAKVDNAKRK